MRTTKSLIVAFLAPVFAGCVMEVGTDPNRFSIEPKAAAHLRAPQNVALLNDYVSNPPMPGRRTRLVVDPKQLTETAIAMLGRSLQQQGYTVSTQAEKTVTLRVVPLGYIQQPLRYTAKLVVQAKFGDGTVATIPQENLGATWERAFDGAVLFALNDLLEHEHFVGYMNAATAPPAPAATAPCGAASPTTWTNCIGTYAVPDGSTYVGAFKDGKYHGQGELTWSSGVKYVGEFRDGRYHGQGVATRADGSVIHSGKWANGKPLR